MERGQMLPRVENLRRLCLVLKVSPHEFLGLEELAGPPASPSWEEIRPRSDDTADLRRLLRRLRKLTSHQVKLLSLIAGAMVNRNRPAKGRR
ncbi:putative transcriptional repressor [Stigmatella aurantiaca DW4/3-1]|nr:putative transcriptional repressor [Stigmatella aurantiaca DW4/3-1]